MKDDNRTGPSILICDTDAEFVDNCRLMLSAWRYRSDYLSECTHVLDVITTQPVDLILIDMNFFETSSLLIVRLLKSFHLTKNIPIIMLSFDEVQEESARKAGADGFVKRPIDWKMLRDEISLALGSKEVRGLH